MKTTLGIAMVLLAGSLAACGGGGGSTPVPDHSGVYVVDVDRTLAAETMTPAARARYEASFDPNAWKLDLVSGGTFELRMTQGNGQAFVLKGSWTGAADNVTLKATETDGTAIPAGEQQDDVIPYDGDVLRLTQGAKEMVLRRL